MPTVVFDLDGTLADTSRDLVNAANHCFRGLGLGDVLDPVSDAGTALRGGRAMLTLGFSRTQSHPPEEIDRQYPILLEAYGNDVCTHTVLYPNAMQAVSELKDAGFKVSICTNKPQGLAIDVLTKLGVLSEFHSLIGADTLPVRKPDPEPLREAVRRAGGDPARCLLVGDSDTDFKTARAAGVPSVLVTFSPAGRSVAALGPDALLDDFSDLPAIAARLIG